MPYLRTPPQSLTHGEVFDRVIEIRRVARAGDMARARALEEVLYADFIRYVRGNSCEKMLKHMARACLATKSIDIYRG